MRMLCRVVFGSALVLVAANAPAQTRLEGERFETMKSLVHFLDEGADFVNEVAREELRGGTASERALLRALDEFSRSTEAFHRRMDTYQASPWDVGAEVTRLRTLARRTNLRLRRVRAADQLYDDWAAVTEDLDLMQRLLRGERVQVPRAHADWDREGRGGQATGSGGHPHGSGAGSHPRETSPPDSRDVWGRETRETWGRDPLSGSTLQQYRRLAHDLDTQAKRVLQMATAQRADYSANGERLLRDLERFSTETAALHHRTDADRLNPSDMGPATNDLLTRARAADRSMREARVYMTVWEEWGSAIRMLEQMVNLLR